MMYFNWQRSGLTPGTPYDRTSPNIAAIRDHVRARFGGTNLGTYGVRPITGGSQWSSHAFGAAWDWGYGADNALRLRVIDWLIANHEALHVQMIVDEGHDRVWKSHRAELGGPGWKAVDIVGWAWLHIETTKDGWGDGTPVEQRLGTPAPAPVPTGAPTMADVAAALAVAKRTVLRLGSKGNAVEWAQIALRNAGHRVALDGNFGPQVDGAVRAFQTAKRITVDGVVGKQTWARLWP